MPQREQLLIEIDRAREVALVGRHHGPVVEDPRLRGRVAGFLGEAQCVFECALSLVVVMVAMRGECDVVEAAREPGTVVEIGEDLLGLGIGRLGLGIATERPQRPAFVKQRLREQHASTALAGEHDGAVGVNALSLDVIRGLGGVRFRQLDPRIAADLRDLAQLIERRVRTLGIARTRLCLCELEPVVEAAREELEQRPVGLDRLVPLLGRLAIPRFDREAVLLRQARHVIERELCLGRSVGVVTELLPGRGERGVDKRIVGRFVCCLDQRVARIDELVAAVLREAIGVITRAAFSGSTVPALPVGGSIPSACSRSPASWRPSTRRSLPSPVTSAATSPVVVS